MKKKLITVFGALCLLVITDVNAQEENAGSPNFPKMDASPMDLANYRNHNDEVVARVIYSRPQRRNREIFGKLVPYNQVWRTGANEATELTLYKKTKVANVNIDAGTYTLYSIPKEKEWIIILNKKTHTWGAYEYAEKDDIVRINVPVRDSANPIEHLSMTFEGNEDDQTANLLIGWDTKYVKVPFKIIK